MNAAGRIFPLILALKWRCQCCEEQIQAKLGLSRAQFHGLIVLDDSQEISGCVFAARMGLSPSRGSRVLSKLLEDGYVKANVSKEDRRTILVSLTAKGRRTRQRINSSMAACEKRVADRLDRNDLQQVTHALELLNATL
jgi:DNA-binding MarR family transcriptional regulator